MSKNNNRDDFTPLIKATAAKRVGYQCSICSCLTTAASQESKKDVMNIGVAAHICAAAPNGPRYDPSMTVEERRSIDNCIWLCQTHSKMIDEDIITYPVERLKKIKDTTEKRVNEALVKGTSFSQDVQNGGFTPEKTYEILNSLITNGDFLNLKLYLESMKDVTMSLELLDIYNYFGIVYQFYCNRERINISIQNYLSNNVKNYVDKLVELFAQFFDKDLLKKTIEYCSDSKLKKICQYIITDNLEGNIFIKETNNEKSEIEIEKLIEGSFLHKMSTNYCMENHYRLKDKDGEIQYYQSDYYYTQKSNLLNLYNKAVELIYMKKQKVNDIKGFNEFKMEIPKIKQLSPELQLYFWKKILSIANYLDDIDTFNNLYPDCCDYIKENMDIKQCYIIHQIEQNIDDVDYFDVRKCCETTKDYRLALTYLNDLLNINDKKMSNIFNENLYLLKENIGFLDLYIRMKKKNKKSNFSPLVFLLGYKTIYSDDLPYNILLCYYSLNNKKYKSTNIKAYNYILKKEISSTLEGMYLNYLIIIYSYKKNYEKLKALYELNPISSFKIQIANCLQNSSDKSDLLLSKSIYLEVLQISPDLNEVYSELFSVNYKLKLYNEAKQAILKALELNFNMLDLKKLLQLKLETIDYEIDKYITLAEKSTDSDILMLIGMLYLNNADDYKTKAFDFLLKSLLINDKSENALNAIVSLSCDYNNYDTPTNIVAGTMSILENEKHKLRIAIHKDSLLNNITPNNFANILHFKENDRFVENILYAKIGDEVTYKNEQYKVVAIDNIVNITFGYAMSQIASSNRVVTFSGTQEESVQKMIKYLEDIKKHTNKIVDVYNQSQCNLPISVFSNQIGKKILECYSFLYYENKSKYKNLNNSGCNFEKYKGYILSFDIIYALAILDIDADMLKSMNCSCSLLTKRIMISEITSFVTSLKSPTYGGTVYVRDGQLYRTETSDEYKKNQLKFFNRLKRILDSLKTPQQDYVYYGSKDLEDLFYKRNLPLEEDTIGYAKNSPNLILVNDDPFLSAIILVDKCEAIGLNAFLIQLNLKFEEYLRCLKQISFMNYGNYFTQDVYRFIRKILENIDVDKKASYYDMLLDLLTSKHFKENSLEWSHNNQVTREILKENNIKSGTNDEIENIFVKAAVYNYSREFPKEYKEKVEDIQRRFRIRLFEKDNKTYLETYLEDDINPQGNTD